jgi:glycosyltransferase involved in cell wall biosynthesis
MSLIIPSYNQQEYLADAIESALNQTLPFQEIIVVDDGSTDNSLEIARKYPVKVISQVNKGLASARNTGIMNSTKGDYIMFLDADDILLPEANKKISLIAEQTCVDIIAPSFKCFGKSSDTVILSPEIKLEMFKDGKNYLPYCCAVKRSALLEVGGYSPKMVWGWEDLHLWINLLSRGKTVVTIQEPLVLYRTKDTSMWTESTKHSEELTNQLMKDFPHAFN